MTEKIIPAFFADNDQETVRPANKIEGKLEPHAVSIDARLLDFSAGSESMDIEQFTALSTQEQVDYINHHHLYYLEFLLDHDDRLPTNITADAKQAFDDKLARNFDALTVYHTPMTRYIWTQKDLLASVPSVNLGMMAAKLQEAIADNWYYPDITVTSLLYAEIQRRQPTECLNFSQSQAVAEKLSSQSLIDLRDHFQHEVKPFLPKISVIDQLSDYNQIQLSNLVRAGNFSNESAVLMAMFFATGKETKDRFDYRMFDKRVIESFDGDFILHIGIYPEISNAVMLLLENQPQIFDIFAALVRLYHQDQSLDNVYNNAKQALFFLLSNQEALSPLKLKYIDVKKLSAYIQTVEHYHGGELQVDFSENFQQDIDRQCDEHKQMLVDEYQRQTGDQEQEQTLKQKLLDIYWKKFFSSSGGLEGITKFIETFGFYLADVIDRLDESDQMRWDVIVSWTRLVNQRLDFEELSELYDRQQFRLTAEEFEKLENLARKVYIETYNEKIRQAREYFAQAPFSYKPAISSDGQEVMVKVIDVYGGNWGLLLHSNNTSFTDNGKRDFSDGYDANWFAVDTIKHHGLSTFYSSNEAFRSPPVKGDGVLYGFLDIKPDNILLVHSGDMLAHNSRYGYTAKSPIMFASADKILTQTTNYNEILVKRKNVIPSMVVWSDTSSQHQLDCSLKAVADWNSKAPSKTKKPKMPLPEIPLVVLHQRELAANSLQAAVTHIQRYLDDKDDNELGFGLELYFAALDARNRLISPGKSEQDLFDGLSSKQAQQVIKDVVAQIGTEPVLRVTDHDWLSRNLVKLLDFNIDLSLIDFKQIKVGHLVDYFVDFVRHGVNVEYLLNEIFNDRVATSVVEQHWRFLLEQQVRHDVLLYNMKGDVIVDNLSTLLAYGVSSQSVLQALSKRIIQEEYDKLLAAGVSAQELTAYLQQENAA